jgi:GntR family transcriptional regulator, transcriptional repressor for pyruvate dehydrogenase complex
MQLKPVERNTLVESVFQQLLASIKDGSLAPGDRLPSERELMKSLKVGRSTVREALRSLAIMNLVDMRPGQGSFVKEMSLRSVINPAMLATLMDRNLTTDLLELRKMIEEPAVELAANRATAEELLTLQAIVDECRELHTQGISTAEPSARLHMEIARCTHNGVLVMFIESILGLLTERGAQLEHRPGFYDWEIGSHQGLVDALSARDGRLAHRLMACHLEESFRWLYDQNESNNGG